MSNDWNSRPPPSLGHVRPDPSGRGAGSVRPVPMPPPLRPERGFPAGAVDPRARRSQAGERAREGRSSGLGRFILYSVLGLLGLAAVGVGLLLAFPPTDLVTRQLAAEVERQTGRKLSIGSTGISLMSGLGVTMSNVVLSAPPAMGGAPLIKTDRLDVTVALLPFVVREVKVERLSLTRPVLELRVDGEGRRSWDFAARGPVAPFRYAQAAGRANDAATLPPELRDFAKNSSPPGGAAAKPGHGIAGLSLADVRIIDGTVRYADAKAGIAREIKGLDVRLAMPQAGGAIDINGHLVLTGERLAIDGRLETLREMLAEQPAVLRLKLEGAPLSLAYKGKVVGGGGAGIDGSIGLKAASLERLGRLAAVPLVGANGLGALSVEGGIKASGTSLALANARLALGETRAAGSLGLDSGGARPRIDAKLRFAALDLDRLQGLAGAAMPAASTPGRFAAPPAGSAPTSIDDLLKRADPPAGAPAKGPQVRGFRKGPANQWDTEAIDATPLRAIDADGRFEIDALTWSGVQASAVSAAIELKDGHLRVTVTDGGVAGGKVRGLASIDARQAAFTVGANLSGDNVAVAPLLKAAGIDILEGRGRTVIAISARGASERELVSTLNGKAEVKVTDGALIGWDVNAMIGGLGGLARGEVPSTRRQADARTPFRQLSGTFQIANGVARTRDMALDSPTLVASGAGTVNIVDRNLDLTFKPKIPGSGLEVPVRVAGSWEDPSVIPDVAAALNSPQAKEAIRQLKDGDVDGALKSVLGSGAKGEKQLDKAKELLRGIFRQ